MSILIKGMEMPENCRDCGIEQEGFWCGALDGYQNTRCFTNERREDCPLVEVPVDYDELLKAAQAMHTWIFLHSGNEKLAYKACGLSDEMNALLGYSGSYTVTISADKDGEQ